MGLSIVLAVAHAGLSSPSRRRGFRRAAGGRGEHAPVLGEPVAEPSHGAGSSRRSFGPGMLAPWLPSQCPRRWPMAGRGVGPVQGVAAGVHSVRCM